MVGASANGVGVLKCALESKHLVYILNIKHLYELVSNPAPFAG